jgi:hypothetical protein
MTRLIVAVTVAITIAAAGVTAYSWVSLGDVPMSAAGYVALVAGSVLTLAVGAGLIFLMYYSNRAGFDDQPRVQMGDAEDGQQPPAGRG